MSAKKKRRVLGGKLLCSNLLCGKVALVILIEDTQQGIYKLNEYMCADCNSIMVMEINKRVKESHGNTKGEQPE